MPPNFDRQLLGDVGLRLDDDEYVRVIAGMGASPITWRSSARGEHMSLEWKPRKFLEARNQLNVPRSINVRLDSHRTNWRYLLDSTDKRILVRESDFDTVEFDLIAIARVLNWPAAGTESVIVEKEALRADLRWQWPLRIAAFPNEFETLGLARLRKAYPSKSLAEVDALTREHARCEILVMQGSLRDALRRILELPHQVRACHILVLGPADIEWRGIRSHVDALFAETQAGALSLLSLLPSAKISDLLNLMVTELSHNEPYDFALTHAFPRDSSLHAMDLRMLDRTALTNLARNLSRRLKKLPTNVSFTLPTGVLQRLNMQDPTLWTRTESADLAMALETRTHELSFEHESEGATGLTHIAAAVDEARRNAAHSESPRFLQGDLLWVSNGRMARETRGLIVGSRYQLEVYIGPPGEGDIEADVGFPDNRLDWREKDSYTLQVLFAEPNQWDQPLNGTIDFPRKGTSSKCRFVFSPTRNGPFAGRVTVYYRGRVLQTALLKMVVVAAPSDLTTLSSSEPLNFKVEAEVRRSLSTLEDRRRFDACLVLNHTAVGKPTMTAAGKEGAFIASLEGIKPAMTNISTILSQVAHDSKRYGTGLTSKGNAKLLCQPSVPISVGHFASLQLE